VLSKEPLLQGREKRWRASERACFLEDTRNQYDRLDDLVCASCVNEEAYEEAYLQTEAMLEAGQLQTVSPDSTFKRDGMVIINEGDLLRARTGGGGSRAVTPESPDRQDSMMVVSYQPFPPAQPWNSCELLTIPSSSHLTQRGLLCHG